MDLYVFAIGILRFCSSAGCPKNAEGIADGGKTGHEKNGRGQKGKKIPQDKDQHPKSDQKQTGQQRTAGYAFARFSKRISLKEKSKHLCLSKKAGLILRPAV